MRWQRLLGRRLDGVAGILAATLGLLMLLGGLGIGLTVLSSPEPTSQIVTAFVLAAVGIINLRFSHKVSKADLRAVILSGAATTILILFLGVGLRDFGEPLWLHGVYLVLLLTVWLRATGRPTLVA